MRRHAEREKWKLEREKAAHKANLKAAQKTADAAANNAVKLERARALLIDKILKAVEQMPEKSGSRIRQTHTDKENNNQLTLDYDLGQLVAAFEKLSSGNTADFERQKKFTEENNETLMSYADLFKRPARQRTIEELESGGDKDV